MKIKRFLLPEDRVIWVFLTFEIKFIFILSLFYISGTVGTALIEQILRSCNVRKIYLLLRPKKSMSVEERLMKVKEEMVS